MDDEYYQKLKDYSLRLLSFRPRTKKELQRKLTHFIQKRKWKENLVERVMYNLETENLVNDEEFVSWWIRQRSEFRPKGERVLRLELQRIGVDKVTIEKVFLENYNSANEVELAKQVAEKKLFRLGSYPYETKKKKVIDLLLRRGFDWETVSQVVDSTLKKEYNKDVTIND